MRRAPWIALALLLPLLFLAAEVRAHGGKSHRLMGTVVSLAEERLAIATTDGEEAAVRLTPATRFERDGKAVERSAVTAGTRVSITLTEDDTTAVVVKVGAAPKAR
jgi:hypothetical protein